MACFPALLPFSRGRGPKTGSATSPRSGTVLLARSTDSGAAADKAADGLVTICQQMHLAITGLEELMRIEFHDYPTAPVIESVPGIGVILGARILAEIGNDPGRFTTARGLRAFAGTAPVTRTPGRSHFHVRTWAGFTYVAFIVDVFSLCIVTLNAATTMATDLLMTPLRMTLWQRDREGHPVEPKSLISPSDAGSQGGFNRSSQHLTFVVTVDARPELWREFAIRESFVARVLSVCAMAARPSAVQRDKSVRLGK